MTWIVLIWLRVGQVAGSCERDGESSGSIKCGEFLVDEDLLASEGLCSM
jgi:hypothetical protein